MFDLAEAAHRRYPLAVQARGWFTQWWFSLTLLAGYLAVFHLWLPSSREHIVVSGVIWVLLFSGLQAHAWRSRYFAGLWDACWHATVILDVLLEATLVRWHDGLSFYLCALAFGVVVGGYRRWAMKRFRGSRESPDPALTTGP